MKLIDMHNDTGLKTAVSLAVAVALAPAAVDMYLASMPQMAVDLNLLALSAAFFFVFAYIGGSSYVYQNNCGISSEQFGLIFGLTSVSLVLGASSSAYFVEKISIPKLALIGAAIMTLGSLACVTMHFFNVGLIGIVLGIAIGLFGLGILEPPLMTAAMDSQTTSLGSTAALLGAFPLLLSSTATPLAGHLVELDALYWLILLGLIGPIILLLVYMSTKQVVATTENISQPSIAMK